MINTFQRDWHRARHSVLAHNAGWMLLGQTSNLVLQALYFAVLGRLLGSTEYGIYVGAFAFVSILSAFSSMGSGTLLLRYVSINRSRFGTYWGNLLLTTTCFGGVIIGVAHLCAPRILNPMSASLVLFAGIAGCFCGEITRNAAIVFQAYEEMQITAIISFSSNVARCAAAIWLLVAYQHVSALRWALAAMFVSMAAAAVSVITVLYRYGKPTFSFDLLLKSIPEGFNYSFATSTGTIYNDVDKSILSHFGFNQANGIYSLAYRIIDAASSPIAAILEAIIPALSRGRKRYSRIEEIHSSSIDPLDSRFRRYCDYSLCRCSASFLSSGKELRSECNGDTLALPDSSLSQCTRYDPQHADINLRYIAPCRHLAGFNLSINLYWIPLFGWKGAAASSLLSDSLSAVVNSAIFVVLCRRAVSADHLALRR